MTKYIVLLLCISSFALASGLVGLPKEILGFEKWAVVAKITDTDGAHPGQNKQVFANKIAAAAWKKSGKLPIGSVVIKTGGKVTQPNFIAVMYKRQAGWYYEEYFPRGGRYSIGAGGKGGQALCKDCHAGGTDELFTR
ncbi:MAG: cytochrome P460 family protein [Deinococcales bacterium]